MELTKKLLFVFLIALSVGVGGCSQSVFTDPSSGSCTDKGSANTGNGTCTVNSVTAFVTTEDITLTATTTGPNATFSVTGSVSGSLGTITSGSAQTVTDSNGYDLFSVTLSDGGTAYAVNDDFEFSLTAGSELKESNFDLFDLEEVCSNGCDTGSASLEVPDGGTSDTAIQNSGDADTGLTFDATDVMQVIAGGNEVCEFGSSSLTCSQDVLPSADNSKDIGSSSKRFAEIHSSSSIASTLQLKGSTTGNVELKSADSVSTPYDIKFPDAEAAGSGEAMTVSSVGSNIVNLQWGAAGDASWKMQDAGSGQIRFKAGSRVVNGTVEDVSSDITTNSTVVAVTDDTLTTVDASNGFLYEASDTIRIYTFYDTIDDEYEAIGDTTDDDEWDYRNDDPDFDLNLARYVPIGYVDVTATGSPGTVTVSITNFPVQAWTTFNNTAAAEKPKDWTPAFTNDSGNSSVKFARYQRIGNRVRGYATITWSGAGTASDLYLNTSSLPVSALTQTTGSGGDDNILIGYAYPIGFTTESPLAVILDVNNDRIFFANNNVAGAGGAIEGNQFASGDKLYFVLDYEIDDADAYQPLTVGFPSVDDLVQEKILSSNVSSTGDVSSLSFTNLKVGRRYEVTAQVRFLGGTAGNDIVEFRDSSGGGGNRHARVAITDGEDVNKFSSFSFTAQTSNLYFNVNALTNSIGGSGNKDRTFIQIKEVPQSGVGVLLPEPGPDKVLVNSPTGYGSTNTKIRYYTNTSVSKGSAITVSNSSTDGTSFTINETGVYSIRIWDKRTSSLGYLGISKNSNQLTTSIFGISNDDIVGLSEVGTDRRMVSATVRLKSGDVIRHHGDGNLDDTGSVPSMVIERVTGF